MNETKNMKFKSVKISNKLRRTAIGLPVLGALCLGMSMSSCESLYDDQSDCRTGINLAFIYDYHMEPGANAFPANVDCVTVYVFDPQGNYLTQLTETSDELRDENYRMPLELPEGSYHLVVYGGTTCEDATVEFTPGWTSSTTSGHKNDILVTVPTDANGESAKQLHDIDTRTGGLFYGTLDVTITEKDFTMGTFRTETVNLMKDTNHIQVILQELSQPDQMNHEDYDFFIDDDNFTLNGYNNPVYTTSRGGALTGKTYKPFARQNRIMGYVDAEGRTGTQVEEDPSKPVQVACAEFSTSRLVTGHAATSRLRVTTSLEQDKDGNDKEIINIPLITYLQATRGFGDTWIKSDQEYLDRQSRWNLMFFLQRNAWVSTRVVVNSWVVRINDIELNQ